MTGKDSHTGSTPMPMRKNAGLGMARVLELVDEIAWSTPHAVGRGGAYRCLSELAQRDPRQGGVHGRSASPDLSVIEDMEARLKIRRAEDLRRHGSGR